MSELPKGPWCWRSSRGGPWDLYSADKAKMVLTTVLRAERDLLAVRDEAGFLIPITPEHPVAKAIEAVPELIAALKELAGRAARITMHDEEVFQRACEAIAKGEA